MCGILGVLNRHCGLDPEKLRLAADSLHHRGPDDEGYLLVDRRGKFHTFSGTDTIGPHSFAPAIASLKSDGSWNCGLAHRRLSILDLSSAGHQPMVDAQHRYALVFNGEVYNYRELHEELKRKNHSFYSGSDAEVVLHAYMEWGADAVLRFIGMWAFAVLDLQQRQLFLSRDRFAIKPLYLYQGNSDFVFASEIKAILVGGWVSPVLDQQMAIQFLVTGRQTVTELTMLQGIRELPAGTNAVYNLDTGNYREVKYYDLRSAVSRHRPSSDNADLAVSVYEDKFKESVSLHMRADVPVGTCLSGGLDSSAITVTAAEMLGGNDFNSFTAVYDDYPDVNERRHAEAVIKSRKNIRPYFAYPRVDSLVRDLEQLTYAQELPFGSTSIYAQWEVMRVASIAGMKVLLDGQGADEALGGYALFGGVFLLDKLKSLNLTTFLRESTALKSNRGISPLKEIIRTLFHQLPQRRRSKFRLRRSFYERIINMDELPNLGALYPVNRTFTDFRSTSYESISSGLHKLLRYEDRNSMAFSIESRVPFLDHRLVEYSLKLPSELKIRNGWTKYPIRALLAGKVDDNIAWRRDKLGFVTPQTQWANVVQKYLLCLLKEVDLPPFIKTRELPRVIENLAFESMGRNEIWRLLSFLVWLKVFEVKTDWV